MYNAPPDPVEEQLANVQSVMVIVSVVEELRWILFRVVVLQLYVEVPLTYVQDAALLRVWCGECEGVCRRMQLIKVQLWLRYDSLFPIPLAIHP